MTLYLQVSQVMNSEGGSSNKFPVGGWSDTVSNCLSKIIVLVKCRLLSSVAN